MEVSSSATCLNVSDTVFKTKLQSKRLLFESKKILNNKYGTEVFNKLVI